MMSHKKQPRKIRIFLFFAIVIVLVLLGTGLIRGCREGKFKQKAQTQKNETSVQSVPGNGTSYGQGAATGAIEKKPDINFQHLETDTALDELMTKRKEDLGVGDSLDMIIQEDEQFIIGDKTISMPDILKKIQAHKGEVYEENIDRAGQITPDQVKEYGVHVVRPKDNIWNIHFRLLKDYFAARNISLSPSADEPGTDGTSSGIGKILKFSENLVSIYNVRENKLVENINIIEPLTKIVIYNMSEIFSLLEEVDYEHVNRIEFDGTNIWIPAKDE